MHKLYDIAEFIAINLPILLHPEFQKRNTYLHHNNSTVYEHSLKVAFLSYKVAKERDYDYVNSARGALLHDFYFTPWMQKIKQKAIPTKDSESNKAPCSTLTSLYYKINNKVLNKIKLRNFPLFKKHGFIHPVEAKINSWKYFPYLMNPIMEDIIVKHMYPLTFPTLGEPLFKESWTVSECDKIISKEVYEHIDTLPQLVGIPPTRDLLNSTSFTKYPEIAINAIFKYLSLFIKPRYRKIKYVKYGVNEYELLKNYIILLYAGETNKLFDDLLNSGIQEPEITKLKLIAAEGLIKSGNPIYTSLAERLINPEHDILSSLNKVELNALNAR